MSRFIVSTFVVLFGFNTFAANDDQGLFTCSGADKGAAVSVTVSVRKDERGLARNVVSTLVVGEERAKSIGVCNGLSTNLHCAATLNGIRYEIYPRVLSLLGVDVISSITVMPFENGKTRAIQLLDCSKL